MRNDYKETGTREEDDFQEFPFGRNCPILVIGILKGNKGIWKEEACGESHLASLLKEAKEKCKRGSIELVGVWPGKWSTDLFDLNFKYCWDKMKSQNRM